MKCLDHFTDETKHIWFAEKAECDFLDIEIIKNTTLLHNAHWHNYKGGRTLLFFLATSP